MTPDNEAPPGNGGQGGLPARRRRSRRGGRHRGAESFALPPDAPTLVLAVPGALSATAGGPAGVAGELATLTEHGHTGHPVELGHLEGDAASLGAALAAAGSAERAPGMPAAVVVPLLTGPDAEIDKALREAVTASGVPAVLAEPLGPHPLIAQALHERLAEAGLARADRVRLLTTVAVAGGIVVTIAGGPAAVREAEVTAVLLASRLAVPVMTASMDGAPGTLGPAEAAARLRNNGATHVAFAPCVIGPEADPGLLDALTAEGAVGRASPLGAHPALAQLIALRYVEAFEKTLGEAPGV